jgi:hypothetical protein
VINACVTTPQHDARDHRSSLGVDFDNWAMSRFSVILLDCEHLELNLIFLRI